MSAKLRHIALSVPDRVRAAEFYEKSFGLTRIKDTGSKTANVIYLSDGTISLALLEY